MDALEVLVQRAVAECTFPGAAYAYGSRTTDHRGFIGRYEYQGSRSVDAETLWDLASLTKVIATTTLFMRAHAAGLVAPQDPVHWVLPEFRSFGKDAITFEHLLLHTSGLRPYREDASSLGSARAVWEAICQEQLVAAPGQETVYSDLGFIALGRALEHLYSASLAVAFEKFALDEGISNLVFAPGPMLAELCAPTEVRPPWRPGDGTYLQGEVHDPTCASMGGVAGHAGLFGTLDAVLEFARCCLDQNFRTVPRALFAQYVKRASPLSSRAWGWDTRSSEGSSAGAHFSLASFGHTGYTGTSLWVDPERGRYAILLSNRVFPDDSSRAILTFRPRFHDAASEILDDE
jgi:CubicO group peptidase (beta-lactamase class C family)